jgi:hypothetical protein
VFVIKVHGLDKCLGHLLHGGVRTEKAAELVYGKPQAFRFYRGGEYTDVDGKKKKAPDIQPVAREDLITAIKKCHNTLWGGGRLSPPTAFGELCKLIFVKISDEQKPRKKGEPYQFQIKTHEPSSKLAKRINDLYNEQKVKDPEVFTDSIKVDDRVLRTVVSHLEAMNLSKTDLDVKGVAFEQFMDGFFKGDFGQYFTPRPIIEFAVKMMKPQHDWDVLDPACGSGGFLLHALDFMRTKAADYFDPGMHAFSEKTYKSLDKNYKKAFYLSRLRRYDEAFFHFSEIAKQAFKDSDYLLYYFAESNCISLRKVIKNVNTWYRCYDLDAVEALSPNDSEAENLFRRLPVEFRNIYDNLRDIHSANMLYKHSYEAFTDGQKLQKAIESGSTEFGMTSSGKAICRVNDYLHFLLGNGIIADVFSEYRSAVKNLMSLLVYKYSTQGKKVLHEQPFPFIDGNDVYFDEIDFHCFIEYFDAKEIIALLSKYHIETIEFQNMASIENAVNNLLDYYSYAVKSSKNNIDVIGLQTQIKNCLALLRYVSISQGLVDKICGFILTQEFREILINDKVLFLDRQLVHRKMYSKTTSKIVENTLISYLDKHIAALKKGERFELFSASTGINYCNLVHYISAPEEKYYSRRLSMRISQIINNNLSQMYYQITQHYCGYVSKNQQKKLITWANKLIQMNFSFDLFKMLVQCDARISKAAKTQLKVYLKQRIDAAKNKNNNGVVVYPTKQPYEELDQVGYWCLLNVLKAKDFQEFLGNSEAFDFYCEYAKFDFSRFDVSWLLNLYPHTLEQIAKNAKVKERVRVAIATTLDGEAIAPSDSQRLQSILVKHFC